MARLGFFISQIKEIGLGSARAVCQNAPHPPLAGSRDPAGKGGAGTCCTGYVGGRDGAIRSGEVIHQGNRACLALLER